MFEGASNLANAVSAAAAFCTFILGLVALHYFRDRNQKLGKANDINANRLELEEQGRIIDRLNQAVINLGAMHNNGQPNIALRIGGIYALSAISRVSAEHHIDVLNLLTAYVRENAPADTAKEGFDRKGYSMRSDITAAMRAIAYRSPERIAQEPPEYILDLSETNLQGLFDSRYSTIENDMVKKANFAGADFSGARLEGAKLINANLDGARLINANLQECMFRDVSLHKTLFSKSNLNFAYLSSLNWQEVSFRKADLRGTVIAFSGADDLANVDFTGAKLGARYMNKRPKYEHYGSIERGAVVSSVDSETKYEDSVKEQRLRPQVRCTRFSVVHPTPKKIDTAFGDSYMGMVWPRDFNFPQHWPPSNQYSDVALYIDAMNARCWPLVKYVDQDKYEYRFDEKATPEDQEKYKDLLDIDDDLRQAYDWLNELSFENRNAWFALVDANPRSLKGDYDALYNKAYKAWYLGYYQQHHW